MCIRDSDTIVGDAFLSQERQILEVGINEELVSLFSRALEVAEADKMCIRDSGNVMIQAMTVGEATDVAGMRQLISRSIPLKTYHPQLSLIHIFFMNQKTEDGWRCAKGSHLILLYLFQNSCGRELFVVIDENVGSGDPLSVEFSPYGFSPAGIGDGEVEAVLIQIVPETTRNDMTDVYKRQGL